MVCSAASRLCQKPTATAAPAAARRCAIARPIPPLPPVTSATRPSSARLPPGWRAVRSCLVLSVTGRCRRGERRAAFRRLPASAVALVPAVVFRLAVALALAGGLGRGRAVRGCGGGSAPPLVGASTPVTTTVLPAGSHPAGYTDRTVPGAPPRAGCHCTWTARPSWRNSLRTVLTGRPVSTAAFTLTSAAFEACGADVLEGTAAAWCCGAGLPRLVSATASSAAAAPSPASAALRHATPPRRPADAAAGVAAARCDRHDGGLRRTRWPSTSARRVPAYGGPACCTGPTGGQPVTGLHQRAAGAGEQRWHSPDRRPARRLP